MAKCPKCKKEIVELNYDVTGTCSSFINADNLYNMDYDLSCLTDGVEFDNFRCPECDEILFNTEEEAKEFLKDTPKDYCDNCETDIEQIDLGDGVFGCPICKRDDCITTFYESEEDAEETIKSIDREKDIEDFTDVELKEEYYKIVKEMQNRGFENQHGVY